MAFCECGYIAAGSPVGLLLGNNPGSTLYFVTQHGDGFQSKAANEKLTAFANKEVLVTGKIIQRDSLRFVELTDVQLPAETRQQLN